jgi:pSer/pThr/pTyr-binding forkhead associated (FHA) protein
MDRKKSITEQEERLRLNPYLEKGSPPKPIAVLRWTDHRGITNKLTLRERDTILIGRDRINNLVLKSRFVSKRHAIISWWQDSFEIADLGSTNGTFVNGITDLRPIPLKHGDVIHLFDVDIIFELL